MIYWIYWGKRAYPVHFWSPKCWHLSNTGAFTQYACRFGKLINATCLKHSLAEFSSRQLLSHFSPKQWCQIYITHLKHLVGASWNHVFLVCSHLGSAYVKYNCPKLYPKKQGLTLQSLGQGHWISRHFFCRRVLMQLSKTMCFSMIVSDKCMKAKIGQGSEYERKFKLAYSVFL